MHISNGFRSRVLVCASFIMLLAAGLAPISAEDARPTNNRLIYQLSQPYAKLEMVEKSTRVLELQGRISTVDVDDSTVITASKVENPFNPRHLRLTAMGPGVSDVVVVDEFGNSFKLEVLVVGDVRYLQTLLQMNFPDAAIQATKVQGTVVLSGWVDQPSQILPIIKMTEQFFPEPINNIQVGGVQQVTLKVKVMEVQRGKIRSLGFNFFNLNDSGYLISNPGNLVPIETLTVPFGGAPGIEFNPANTTAMFGFIGADNIFQGFLEALKEESLLKILAEPNLTVKSGEKANLLQGGEFPILVPQSLGTLSVEFKSFGVKLEALPIVLGNGRLSLQLVPEVSERDFSSAVEFQGQVVPGLTTRRVQTAVEMDFGQTFVIAGIIFDRQTATTFKVPLLGEMPVLGALFRRVQYNQTETELLVMVTPELADPLTPEQVPLKGPGQFTSPPNDRELFFDGVLEVPDYGPECPGCGVEGYVPAHGLITPQADPNYQHAPTTVPPAPAGGGVDTLPPPAPGSEASRMRNAGPNLSGTAPRPGLVAPRFSQAPVQTGRQPGQQPGRQMMVPPSGATPYRNSANSRQARVSGPAGNRAAAAPPRAKTLQQARANRRYNPRTVVQQQKSSSQSKTTVIKQAASAKTSVPSQPNQKRSASPFLFPNEKRNALLKQLDPKQESKKGKRPITPTLVAPPEMSGPSRPAGSSPTGASK